MSSTSNLLSFETVSDGSFNSICTVLGNRWVGTSAIKRGIALAITRGEEDM